MIVIDGSEGEGGGQVLRTALALSALTAQPFRVERLRARRARPGLRRQHLTAVRAAARISGARVEGAALDSAELTFRPGPVRPGEYDFDVGTAGSTTLVLQTVLPALCLAGGPSRIVLSGGTHNPLAPSFDFLAECFLPVVERMGPGVSATLERPGFFPAGGGRLSVEIEPCERLSPMELEDRGPIRARRARAWVSALPTHIGRRELDTAARLLDIPPDGLRLEEVRDAAGPGNALTVAFETEALTEVFCGFGRRGLPAEAVAEGVAREARAWLDAGAPVGRHLADQLLLPLALAGGGSFRTLEPTQHARTNAEVISRFLEVDFSFEPADGRTWRIEVRGRS